MDSALADPLVGRLLDGRYHIRSRIARGGMATVYMASDTRLERLVALKVMHAELARDEGFVSRFIGEAKSVARLSHPNVVQVFDQGSDGEYLYLAMEYVPGRTLRSLLRERGSLPPGEALDVMVPVLSGLAAAHESGIVHRDVKPENVLLTDDGRVKVVDFGLARAQAGAGHTRTGMIIGTVAYLAPEQVTGGVTDLRTDVYSAGVMLFELVTGRQPHTGDTPLAVAYKHVNSDVPLPSALVPGLPPALDQLVAATTNRDPRQRPADAAAFLRAVQMTRADSMTGPLPSWTGETAAWQLPATDAQPELLAARGLDGPAFGSHTMVVADDGFSGYLHGQEPFLQRWLFSRRLVVLAAALGLAAVLGGGIWYLTSGRYSPLPSVAGDTRARATQILTADGFRVQAGTMLTDNAVPRGMVISTQPSGRAVKGSTVTLILSAGPRVVVIPAVTGKTLAQAESTLRGAGLLVSDQPEKVGSSTAATGSVVGTNPAAGTSWPVTRPVAVQVVAGQPLPNFAGQNIADVQAWASQNNVQLSTQNDTKSNQPQGIITRQSPGPDAPITPGMSVTVFVSSGPQQAPVPNVDNMTVAQARKTLQKAGFKVSVSRFGPLDNVFSYSPSGTAPEGSTITIYAGL
jgi:eukaryotic-like serine/threonine-protein kinase